MRFECSYAAGNLRLMAGQPQSAPASSRGTRRLAKIRRRAFSLVEILVVMGLLTVIILGLMAMFHQTQRAFRLGMTQTDVLESGRIVTDMMVRELEQMTPSGLNGGNFNSGNFYSALINGGSPYALPTATPTVYTPFLQPLPGGNERRTNLLDDVFFITRQNQTWTGIGYFVRSNDNFAGVWSPVGTLYRFETNATVMDFPYPAGAASSFFYGFKTAAVPGPVGPSSGVRVSKILDGVIHFRVRAYDINGNWINPWLSATNVASTNYTLLSSLSPPYEGNYFFYSNAVPAFVELELGILEQQTLERYRSIPVYTEQTNFLAHQAAHVHLFRQRIAIRNLDPSAYQ